MKLKIKIYLHKILQLFWDLDSIGIKENEKSVYQNVRDEIELERNRYPLKLPGFNLRINWMLSMNLKTSKKVYEVLFFDM